MNTASSSVLKEIYAPRPEGSVKYDFGLVFVVGGGEFYTGAPALSGLAAFAAGADMVRVIAPKRAADIIASFSPILAAYPVPGDHLLESDLAILLSQVEAGAEVSRNRTSVVIGGGLGRSEGTARAVCEFLAQTTVRAVVDADAIWAVARNPECLMGKGHMLTPHAGEFLALTNREVKGLSPDERAPIVKEEASRLGAAILLKGPVDVVSDGGEVWFNKTGTPYMTVGGTGDVLAGIAGALVSRGTDPVKAASAAAFISGKAGEACTEKESMTALNVIERIKDVLS